jgi:hypothetical protein
MKVSCRQKVRVGRGLWGLRSPGRPAPRQRRAWLYTAAALLLAGYLLFAHGCHRDDEDNELFASFAAAGLTP